MVRNAVELCWWNWQKVETTALTIPAGNLNGNFLFHNLKEIWILQQNLGY
jgi:hypothetical protein